jgi:uncharacterized DUF497 family protein
LGWVQSVAASGSDRITKCSYDRDVGVIWDPHKAKTNFQDHGILFSVDLESVLTDPYSLTVPDDESDSNERRWYTLGLDSMARV